MAASEAQRRLLRRLNLPQPIAKFNPHHDRLGRFASGGGGGMSLHNGRQDGPKLTDDVEVNLAMQKAWDTAKAKGYPHPDDPRNGDPKYAAECARLDTLMAQVRREGNATDQLYTDGEGHYTKERSKLHEEIADEIIREAIENGAVSEGKALWFGGLPGAGKTTLLHSGQMDKLGIDPTKYVTHDPDAVKAKMIERGMLPTDKWHGLKPNEATGLFHVESCEIADLVMAKATQHGLNILFDGTMKNIDQVRTQMGYVREGLGGFKYQLEGVFVHTDSKVSFESAKNRHLAGGRYVPYDIQLTAAPAHQKTKPEQTFSTLKRNEFDRYAEFVRLAPREEAKMTRGLKRKPMLGPPEPLQFQLLSTNIAKRVRSLIRKAEPWGTEVTRWIMAYKAGLLDWSTLEARIMHYPFVRPDMGGDAGYGDMIDEADGTHFLPGTWGEVTAHWGAGNLTDDEYFTLLGLVSKNPRR